MMKDRRRTPLAMPCGVARSWMIDRQRDASRIAEEVRAQRRFEIICARELMGDPD